MDFLQKQGKIEKADSFQQMDEGSVALATPAPSKAARGQLPVAGWPCSERGEADPRDAAGSAQEEPWRFRSPGGGGGWDGMGLGWVGLVPCSVFLLE